MSSNAALIRTYNAALAISLSASRHPISGAITPTGEDGVTLRVGLRRQRPVRVHVERCEAEIQSLGSPHGSLDVGSQVGWALTQALTAADDGSSLASGGEVSYLHISKHEQLTRFKERLEDPTKQWKISKADYEERTFWDDYMAAYEDVLSRCSTKHAPWFVIPSDHKWFRNLAIARIVVEYLEGWDMKFPAPSVDLEQIRREYHAAREG